MYRSTRRSIKNKTSPLILFAECTLEGDALERLVNIPDRYTMFVPYTDSDYLSRIAGQIRAGEGQDAIRETQLYRKLTDVLHYIFKLFYTSDEIAARAEQRSKRGPPVDELFWYRDSPEERYQAVMIKPRVTAGETSEWAVCFMGAQEQRLCDSKGQFVGPLERPYN